MEGISVSKINVQMYSFSEGFDKKYDNEANFRSAAEMGYDGVELFGPNFSMDPKELKKLLEELHLQALSLHAPSTDKVEEMIPFAKELGMEFIGIGMETMLDDAAVHKFAVRLNELGKKCKSEGLVLTYHNHTQEFLPCDDKKVFDVLMEETNPDYVSFELDAGWAAAAGENPLELVKKYSGRVKLIHIKESNLVIGPQPPMDFSSVPKDENGTPIFTEEQKANMLRDKELNCPAGEGLVDWKELQKVADANGCVGYSVEREFTPAPFETRKDVLAADIKYYRSVMV